MALRKWKDPKNRLSFPHRSALAERLAKKIERDTGIACDPNTFARIYAGHNQREEGGWCWTMRLAESLFEIGSSDPASECVKKKYKLTESHSEIYAELIKGKGESDELSRIAGNSE